MSSGTGDEDYSKLKMIVEKLPDVKYICLDVANGYSEHFVTFVRQVRKAFPNHTIMVCKHRVIATLPLDDCNLTEVHLHDPHVHLPPRLVMW